MLTVILGTFCFCFIIERIFTGWKLPQIKTWPFRVVLVNFIQLGVVLLGGVTWETWFHGRSLFEFSEYLGDLAGGFLAYFIATFVFYWWHRLRHESDFLWRVFHQIHHSPARLEVITSFYKHPIEMIANSIIGSLLVYALLGLSPTAGAYYTLFTALGEFFYHTNIRTPRWIGWFFQRPEMHRIHHEANRHKNNYGDITWWDMIFGTYENPKEWKGACGFDIDKELQLWDMIQLKDVHKKNKKSKTMSIVLSLLVVLGGFQNEAYACSVFAKSNSRNEFIVAKNFDWNAPEGLIVINGRQTKRLSFNPVAKKEWIAKNSSITLTTLGPGLPISGMNEKGLTVEALVDWDFKGKIALDHSLTALEWSQYVLDNFDDLNQVKNFATGSNFDQQVVPLHIFVCDPSSECLVIEKRKVGSAELQITGGSALKAKILANNGWQEDYTSAKWYHAQKNRYLNGKDILPKLSSQRRFAALFDANAESEKSTFDSLNHARIPSLIQWQLIWTPANRTVSWRPFKNERPGRINRIDLKKYFNTCSGPTLVADLTSFTPNSFQPYSKQHAEAVGKRVEEMMNWRLGKNFPDFEKDIVKFTQSSTCQKME